MQESAGLVFGVVYTTGFCKGSFDGCRKVLDERLNLEFRGFPLRDVQRMWLRGQFKISLAKISSIGAWGDRVSRDWE